MSSVFAGRPYPGSGIARYAAFAFFITCTVAYVDRQAMSLLYEPIRLEFHLRDAAATLLTGLPFTLVYALAAIPLGRMVDRSHRRNLLIIAVLVWSLSTIACGFSRNIFELGAARLGVGVGEAALGPAVISLIADYFRAERRGRIVGLIAMATLIGSALARIGGGSLLIAFEHGTPSWIAWVGAISPWRAVFVMLGLPGLLCVALLAFVPEPTRQDDPDGSHLSARSRGFAPLIAHLRANRRTVVLTFLAYGLLSFASQAATNWTPVYAIRHFGVSAGVIGQQFGIIALIFGGVGPVAGGWLSDLVAARHRGVARAAVGIVGLLGTSILFLLPLANTLPLFMAVSAGHLFFGTLGIASALPLIVEQYPNRLRGQANALYGICVNLVGGIVGPLLVALLSDHLSSDGSRLMVAILIVFGVATVAGLAAFCALIRHGRKAPIATAS